jgi:hypothetical protein
VRNKINLSPFLVMHRQKMGLSGLWRLKLKSGSERVFILSPKISVRQSPSKPKVYFQIQSINRGGLSQKEQQSSSVFRQTSQLRICLLQPSQPERNPKPPPTTKHNQQNQA